MSGFYISFGLVVTVIIIDIAGIYLFRKLFQFKLARWHHCFAKHQLVLRQELTDGTGLYIWLLGILLSSEHKALRNTVRS